MDISLKNQKIVKIHQKNIKKSIFATKITNTFDFSSQKSKKNWSCFSRTFHMESPNSDSSNIDSNNSDSSNSDSSNSDLSYLY